MDVMADFTATAALLRPLLASLKPSDLGRSTPCSDWTVGALTDHIVANALVFAGLADPASSFAPATEADRGSAYDVAVAAVRASFAPAIERADVIATPFGQLPAAGVLGVCFADQLTHLWDLATALGHDVEIDADLARRAHSVWEGFITDDLRRAGVFGDAVDVATSASPIERMVAFAGRSTS